MTIKEVERIICDTLQNKGISLQKHFNFGEYDNIPNTQGVFQKDGQWYIYSIDEKLVNSISGPFLDSDVIYACTSLMNCAKYFDEYKFSKEAMSTYIHVHYKSIKDIR